MSIVLAKDAFLVFRALCKLSIRSNNESASGLDPPAIRGKVCSRAHPVHHWAISPAMLTEQAQLALASQIAWKVRGVTKTLWLRGASQRIHYVCRC